MTAASPGGERPSEGGAGTGPLQITYLIEGTALFGGVKVALHQANLLAARGHEVTVVAAGQRPDWYPVETAWRSVERLEPQAVPECDLCVATFWTTLEVARSAPCRQAVHFCQGYEGSFFHNREQHPRIREAYQEPLPAMVVSPHLVAFLAGDFGRPARWVPQPLEPFWKPRPWWRRRRRPRSTPHVLVMSPFEIRWKGVEEAVRAVARLKRQGRALRLVRLSQMLLTDQERQIAEPDAFHHRLAPREVAGLMRDCDLLLAPSWEQEGFGLPALEAMACGLPVVATTAPCFEYAEGAVGRVPPRDPQALAEEAERTLRSPGLWRRRRRCGLRVAARFTEERTARAAEEALRWALSGSWRSELEARPPGGQST